MTKTKRIDVQKQIKLLEEKRRWLQRHYCSHGQSIVGIDKTRIEAWKKLAITLRGLKQKTVSQQKMRGILHKVLYEDMHLLSSPFKGVFEYGDTEK